MAFRRTTDLPLLFSTDLTGIFARKPEFFYQLFQTISADCVHLDGVELMPFRFSHERVRLSLKKYNVPVIGLHGPPACNISTRSPVDNLIVALFSAVTPNLKTTLKMNQQLKPQYFLVHEPDLDQPQIRDSITKHFFNWKQNQNVTKQPWLMIENVYRPNSLQETIKKVNQLNRQTKIGLMLDLTHLLHQVTGLNKIFSRFERVLDQKNIDEYWQLLLKQAHQAFSQVPKAGLHIPLGDTGDGLPFELLTNKHWQLLAQLIKHHKKKLLALTIENQHHCARLSLSKNSLPKLIKDKKKKLKILLKTGVI